MTLISVGFLVTEKIVSMCYRIFNRFPLLHYYCLRNFKPLHVNALRFSKQLINACVCSQSESVDRLFLKALRSQKIVALLFFTNQRTVLSLAIKFSARRNEVSLFAETRILLTRHLSKKNSTEYVKSLYELILIGMVH